MEVFPPPDVLISPKSGIFASLLPKLETNCCNQKGPHNEGPKTYFGLWILVFALSLCPSNLATPLTLRKFSKRPEKSFSTCLQSTSGMFALFSSFHPSENCPSCSIFWFACRSKKIPKDWNHTTRSSKSGWVLPTQIFGLFGPPKKRVNFDKFNQRQKCVFCVLTALYVSK